MSIESNTESDYSSEGCVESQADPQNTQASVFQSLLKQRPPKSASSTDAALENPILSRRPGLLSAPQEAALDRQAHSLLRKERRLQLSSLHIRPSALEDITRERRLKRAACRGAVQLFNAVRKHQQSKDANTEKQRARSGGKKSATKDIVKRGKDTEARKDSEPVDFMNLLKSGPGKII